MGPFTLSLIGIGTGSPDHLTRQGIAAINSADLILVPLKGPEKAELADLRGAILDDVLTNPGTRIAPFTLPLREQNPGNYLAAVEDWHTAIAASWQQTIAAHQPAKRVALLIWGDPSLYDSALRIAARLQPRPEIEMIPGITAVQALTAAHKIALNTVGAPVTITTGRKLRESGFPPGVNTAVVMLDGQCSFQHLSPEGIEIFWGAYVGMPQQVLRAGPLSVAAPQIIQARAEAREKHGWIMDIYLLRRQGR